MPSGPASVSGKSWSRPELLIAMHLYCQIPFGQFHARNPIIIDMSARMGRTPSSLAMKLCNLASLDSNHQSRGVIGLKRASQGDRDIWREFLSDWTRMIAESADEAERILRLNDSDQLVPISVEDNDSENVDIAVNTERTANVRIRRGQSFFRASVLTAYGSKCCVTGCSTPSFLVASHIVPWSHDEKNRLNPQNGLCLAVLQDRAFDKGYIGLSDECRILISRELASLKADPVVGSHLLPFEGKSIVMPERFKPDLEFVKWHRKTIFSLRN